MNISKTLGVASIEDKMKETRLHWFGHVQRRPIGAPVRCCGTRNFKDKNQTKTKRGRGRPKKTLWETCKTDTRTYV